MPTQPVLPSTLSKTESEEVIRFAVFIPKAVFRNFEVYCLAKTERKQQVLLAALIEYLRNRGMEPEHTPLVNYSYPSQ